MTYSNLRRPYLLLNFGDDEIRSIDCSLLVAKMLVKYNLIIQYLLKMYDIKLSKYALHGKFTTLPTRSGIINIEYLSKISRLAELLN